MRPTHFVSRALAIAGYVLVHSLRFLGGWLWRVVRLRPREERQEWFGASVLALFRDLGATFIKVGQIMSSRPDLLPPHIIRALSQLQDNVGPFALASVREIIAADLGAPVEQVFVEFAPAPIASASVAQVHRARLPG